MGIEDDQRAIPAGGRRDYDPPAVSLREHFETLLAAHTIRIELELAGLGEKIAAFHVASTAEHLAVVNRLTAVETKVETLQASELRREGGSTVKSRGWQAFIALAGLVIAVLAVYGPPHQ